MHHDRPAEPHDLSRRQFLKTAVGGSIAVGLPPCVSGANAAAIGARQATGCRVGDVTDSSAIVWIRLTKSETRNNGGTPIDGRVTKKDQALEIDPDEVQGACPGMTGRVRLRYGLKPDLSDAKETAWVDVNDGTDCIHQFTLNGLQPGKTYHYESVTADQDGAAHGTLRGQFHTAPAADDAAAFRFCVMTCQSYRDRDHAEGHPIYPAMQALDPRFIALTGDLVYYDSDAPRATTPRLARLHWERMFSMPRLLSALRQTSTYWLKDDHDTLKDDSYPGEKSGELTFAEGQKIFHEQAPMGERSYRTFRWGKDLQIWFTDGRDYRSPNTMPDGPDKTIWGAEQKAWFKKTVKESDAAWKILISPTPIVGPDRPKKNDNHSNAGFAHEGDEIRAWIRDNVPDHFFIVCGDRHWQYHSIHPDTGVQEFSVGAASDSHAGGTPGENQRYHRFHRVKGGFLCVDLSREGKESVLKFQLRDVDGQIVHEAPFRRAIA